MTCGPFLEARACNLAPEAADVDRASGLAAEELAGMPHRHAALTQQAALEVRAGHPDKAVPLLRQVLTEYPRWQGSVLPRLWLALAQHAQHKDDEARKELAEAVVRLDQWGPQMPRPGPGEAGAIPLHLHDWLEVQVLRREAENLLDPRPR
jgi:hypothetical protein